MLKGVLGDEKPQGKMTTDSNANRVPENIEIDESFLKNKEQLENYLILTLNRLLKKRIMLINKK